MRGFRELVGGGRVEGWAMGVASEGRRSCGLWRGVPAAMANVIHTMCLCWSIG